MLFMFVWLLFPLARLREELKSYYACGFVFCLVLKFCFMYFNLSYCKIHTIVSLSPTMVDNNIAITGFCFFC